jgi:hypothetical protein
MYCFCKYIHLRWIYIIPFTFQNFEDQYTQTNTFVSYFVWMYSTLYY